MNINDMRDLIGLWLLLSLRLLLLLNATHVEPPSATRSLSLSQLLITGQRAETLRMTDQTRLRLLQRERDRRREFNFRITTLSSRAKQKDADLNEIVLTKSVF